MKIKRSRIWEIIKREKLLQLVGILLISIFLSSILVFLFEKEGNKKDFANLFDAIWWAIVTVGTVGYGDKIPHTFPGKIVGMSLIFFWIGFAAIFSATITSVFVEQKIKEEKGQNWINSRKHIVILGWNFNTPKIIQEIVERYRNIEIVLVNQLSEEEINNIKFQFEGLNLKFIHGDFTQENTLKRANISEANAVIIVADTSGGNVYEKADERIIIAAHTVRYLSPKVRISAELLNSSNEQHLRRIEVDDVIISSEYGGPLLAKSALSPGIPQVVKNLISSGERGELHRMNIPREFLGKNFKELFQYFRNKNKGILIGILNEERIIGLEDILSDDTSAIDLFLKKKLRESQKEHLVKPAGKIKINLNPPDEYIIQEDDEAVVIV
jgi:voltage-gated potassium channel